MSDAEPQIAGGKVLSLAFTMSLDGFVAAPNHEMDWLSGVTSRLGLIEEYPRHREQHTDRLGRVAAVEQCVEPVEEPMGEVEYVFVLLG